MNVRVPPLYETKFETEKLLKKITYKDLVNLEPGAAGALSRFPVSFFASVRIAAHPLY